MNIFLQLGVDGFVRRRLKRWGVDLDDQSKNQQLARIGSCGGEDPFVTIDLRGASDTVSLAVCEYYLPDEWNSYLLQLRSPCASLDGTTYWLQKMSAMGNGFTFVLESALFTALIYGVMKATSGYFDRDAFAVYGDDLIVRQSIAKRLIELLTMSGFAVNVEKTFLEGPVRESCGTDWFEGKPVRPVFLDNAPNNVIELFSARNRIKRSLELRWGLEESKTVELFDKWVPEIYQDHIGPYSDTEFGSHLHGSCRGQKTPLHGMWKQWWEYKRVLYSPRVYRRARSFLFRRLMHDLRPAPLRQKWEEDSAGSRFTVRLRTSKRPVGTQCSRAFVWPVKYTETLPGLITP
jgi:hypothetical protein